MILAPLVALLAAGSWGTADFISRKPSQRIGYYSATFYVQLFGFVGLGAYLAFSHAVSIGTIESHGELLIINLLIGILIFGATVLLYRAYLRGVMSVVAPIASSYPVVTIILSVALLGATISSTTKLGIALVLFGMILTGIRLSEFERLSRKHAHSSKTSLSVRQPDVQGSSESRGDQMSKDRERGRVISGVGSALVSFLFLGFAFFGLALVTGTFGQLLPVMILRGSAALVGFLLLIPLRQKLTIPRDAALLWLILLSSLDTLGFVFFSYSATLAGQDLPAVVTLSAQFSAVTVLLARVFYKEKLEPLKYMGIVMILLGIGVTLYF